MSVFSYHKNYNVYNISIKQSFKKCKVINQLSEPMNRNSTLKGKKLISKKEVSPTTKTLDFLKMFARSYYTDKNLPTSLNGTILN